MPRNVEVDAEDPARLLHDGGAGLRQLGVSVGREDPEKDVRKALQGRAEVGKSIADLEVAARIGDRLAQEVVF